MKAIDDLDDLELIGTGGNAHVYRARDTVHDRLVAVKILRAGGDVVRRRFDRERRSMGRLSGIPGLLTVYSSGYTADDDPYLVMPYCPGGSLKDRIDEDGPLPVGEALAYMRGVALGVEEAHQRDVLHCDIKPSNILLNHDGLPLLADFGIAELVGQTTSISGAMVTPSYTPPERFDGEGPSRAGDIYALGATLYALVAGHAPFGSEPATSQAVLIRQILEEPLPLEALPAAVPASVRKLIDRATAKSASDRFASAGELATALDTEAKKLVGTTPMVEAPAPTPPPPPTDYVAIPIPADPLAAADPSVEVPTRPSPFDPYEDRPAPGFRSGRSVPERVEMNEIGEYSALRQPRVSQPDNPTRARPTTTTPPPPKSKAPALLGALALVLAGLGAYWYLSRTPPLDEPNNLALSRTTAATATLRFDAEDDFTYRIVTRDPSVPVVSIPPDASVPSSTPRAAGTIGTSPFTIALGYDETICVQVEASFEGNSATSRELCLDAEGAPLTESIITIATDDNVIVSGVVGSRAEADDIIEEAEGIFDQAVVRDHLWVEQSVLTGTIRVESISARHSNAEIEQFQRFADAIDAPFVRIDDANPADVLSLSGRRGERIDPAVLQAWTTHIAANPNTAFDIRASTTRLGSAATNQWYSQLRAAEIVAALVEAGTPARQLRAVGTGETAPGLPTATLTIQP